MKSFILLILISIQSFANDCDFLYSHTNKSVVAKLIRERALSPLLRTRTRSYNGVVTGGITQNAIGAADPRRTLRTSEFDRFLSIVGGPRFSSKYNDDQQLYWVYKDEVDEIRFEPAALEYMANVTAMIRSKQQYFSDEMVQTWFSILIDESRTAPITHSKIWNTLSRGTRWRETKFIEDYIKLHFQDSWITDAYVLKPHLINERQVDVSKAIVGVEKLDQLYFQYLEQLVAWYDSKFNKNISYTPKRVDASIGNIKSYVDLDWMFNVGFYARPLMHQSHISAAVPHARAWIDQKETKPMDGIIIAVAFVYFNHMSDRTIKSLKAYSIYPNNFKDNEEIKPILDRLTVMGYTSDDRVQAVKDWLISLKRFEDD